MVVVGGGSSSSRRSSSSSSGGSSSGGGGGKGLTGLFRYSVLRTARARETRMGRSLAGLMDDDDDQGGGGGGVRGSTGQCVRSSV